MPVKDNKAKAKRGKISDNPNSIIQNNLEQLISLSNSMDGSGMEKYGRLIREIAAAPIGPLTGNAKDAGKRLSEWEGKVYSRIVKRIVDESGNLKDGAHFALGSVSKDADREFGIGFDAASLIVNLLEKRGLARPLTNRELAEGVGMSDASEYDQRPSGIYSITKLGVVYAAFFLEKRA